MDTLNSIRFFSSELILCIGAIAVLLVNNRRLTEYLCLFTLCLSAISLLPYTLYTLHFTLFFNMAVFDSFGLLFKMIFLAATALVVLLSLAYEPIQAQDRGAYYSLLLFTTMGLMLIANTTNLLMIYLSIEMVSLISYLLVGFLKKDKASSEAGLKYFLFGAASTGIMLYGISIFYGITGTLNIAELNYRINTLGIIALVFVLVGIGFKISLVPLHMWAPDAYEGAPTPITAFLSVGPKLAGLALLLRLAGSVFRIEGVLEILTILTMTVGNIIAISQSNIKRMLAYSSIAQAGYILIGFVTQTLRGAEGVLIYILAYLFMNLGAFGVVIAISNTLKTERIEDYAGLSNYSGGLALILTLFLLSLAGIPPMAGFIGKFYVFSAAIEKGMIRLAIAGVLNSVVALYYYVKVIRYMYLAEPSIGFKTQTQAAILKPLSLKLVLGISVAGTLIIGIMPGAFIEWLTKIV